MHYVSLLCMRSHRSEESQVTPKKAFTGALQKPEEFRPAFKFFKNFPEVGFFILDFCLVYG